MAGISASAGIGIGNAFVYAKDGPRIARRRIPAQQVEAEVERFLATLHQVSEEIHGTRRLVEQEHGSDLARIFEAQLAMVEDVAVKEQTLTWIRKKCYPADRAFYLTLQGIKRAFKRIESGYLRARLGDVMDIERQVLIRLAGGELQALRSLRANAVVVARDLLPSEMVQLGQRRVKGLVLEVGGTTSHSSIIARSLGLPTVVGVEGASRQIPPGELVVVDGNQGLVHLQPDPETLRFYQGERERQRRRARLLTTHRQLPAVTRDGKPIALLANIDVPLEVQTAVDNGAQGVGMYRTEFLYLGHRLPTEEEQVAAYARIVEAMAPRPVVIRTIDLGGDKLAHVLDTTPEANPFLGWRGIRISLDTPEMFKTQLRAVLRAGAKGEVQILLPMISSLDEIRRARVLLEETKTELRASGQPFQKQCKLGVMVEVPAVALMADQFAREADFFSLGTNDLVQYTLAVDRGASRVADLYDPFHPAVLRLIRMVADSGRQRGIPVSICGEMAGDPRATGLLLGLGLEQLSTNPGLLPQIKEAVRSVDLARSRQVAAHCVELDTGAAVRRYLEQEMSAGEP